MSEETLRKRAFDAIASHRASSSQDVSDLFCVTAGQAQDAIHGLLDAGAIRRDAATAGEKWASYTAVAGAKIANETRGGDQKSINKKTAAKPRVRHDRVWTMPPKTALEECWPLPG